MTISTVGPVVCHMPPDAILPLDTEPVVYLSIICNPYIKLPKYRLSGILSENKSDVITFPPCWG